MSPLTAMFLGIFGVVAVAILAGTSTLLYGMTIVDQKASALIGFAENTLEGLPELLASLPPAISDALSDRREPAYAAKIAVSVRFVADQDGVRPVLTVNNKGDEVVSLLALRVAALNAKRVAVYDWSEVVATPIAIDDDWRGPLMPGAERQVVLHRCRSLPAQSAESIEGAVEIADVRVWVPKAQM
jgi:hypothetical protein